MNLSIVIISMLALSSLALGNFAGFSQVKGAKQEMVRSVIEVLPTYTPTPTNTPTPTTTPTQIPTRTPTPTPIPVPTRVAASAQDIDKWFEQYAREFSVDIALLRKIAVCESGYNSISNNNKHNYGGMFQFSVGTWKSTRISMGVDPNPDLRFSPQEAIKTAAYKISRNGTSAWPACSK